MFGPPGLARTLVADCLDDAKSGSVGQKAFRMNFFSRLRSSAAVRGTGKNDQRSNVCRRATADEDGHYVFAVAL